MEKLVLIKATGVIIRYIFIINLLSDLSNKVLLKIILILIIILME